jgi:hypothetical protein
MNLFATMISTTLGAYLVTFYHKGSLKKSKEMTKVLKLYWFLSNSVVLFSCTISFIYWKFLYHGQDTNLTNWLTHATNCIFLVIDLFIVNYPHRYSHAIYPMMCGSLYVAFSFLYPYLGGTNREGDNFIYPILDWKCYPRQAIAVGVGSVIALGLLHIIVGFIHATRRSIHKITMKPPNRNDNQLRMNAQDLQAIDLVFHEIFSNTQT